MKNNATIALSAASFHPSSSPVPIPAPGEAGGKTGPGRPSCLNERMIEGLCLVIRETGMSDSGAAARMSLHPSTLSRWKKESPDLAILLRSAREDFRTAQLSVILDTARQGGATGWRAAAWLLERVFPEDYSPRAAERAKFQERFDAICASEQEGGEVALPHEGEALQNVKNEGDPTQPEQAPRFPGTRPVRASELPPPVTPLQNVKYPPSASTHTRKGQTGNNRGLHEAALPQPL
ncbi:MAG TPA: hypothetical protein VGO11_12000 [Chthoniobacteraceae bacterium]|jgi:hypothetical protein|nr:hypothetical protein [Chthoniobacteraceae bacterium]